MKELYGIIVIITFLNFYLYICLPDLQESGGGANTPDKQSPWPTFGDAKILLSG